MIERASEFGASAAVPLVTGDASLATAGDMLRAAREAHGIDVAVVAAALKVPVQKVEALEAGDIEALPDPVFARALAASMCRALRIDPKPVLEKLPGARQPGLSGAKFRAKSASFKAAPARSGGGGGIGSRILVVVVALLLIGAALMVWLPPAKLEQLSAAIDHALSRGGEATQQAGPASAEGAVSAPPGAETQVALAPVVGMQPAPAAVAAAPGPAAAARPGDPAAPAAAPSGAQPAAAASAPAAGAAPAAGQPATTGVPAVNGAAGASAAPADSLLAFDARSETWISVTDADGKQLLRRLVQPGEKVALTGAPPLAVVIGRASGVDVQVRGKPFDLAPITRSGGVARFEVKP